MSRRINLDVLALKLREVDTAGYDHPLMSKVLEYLGCLCEKDQRLVIKVALGQDVSYEELLEHVKAQYFVLKQKDGKGKYCALGFGDHCVGVATWDNWTTPEHAESVRTNPYCYTGEDGKLRCGHLMDFAELMMRRDNQNFKQFLTDLNWSHE